MKKFPLIALVLVLIATALAGCRGPMDDTSHSTAPSTRTSTAPSTSQTATAPSSSSTALPMPSVSLPDATSPTDSAARMPHMPRL